jgi:hypothetical protein
MTRVFLWRNNSLKTCFKHKDGGIAILGESTGDDVPSGSATNNNIVVHERWKPGRIFIDEAGGELRTSQHRDSGWSEKAMHIELWVCD